MVTKPSKSKLKQEGSLGQDINTSDARFKATTSKGLHPNPLIANGKAVFDPNSSVGLELIAQLTGFGKAASYHVASELVKTNLDWESPQAEEIWTSLDGRNLLFFLIVKIRIHGFAIIVKMKDKNPAWAVFSKADLVPGSVQFDKWGKPIAFSIEYWNMDNSQLIHLNVKSPDEFLWCDPLNTVDYEGISDLKAVRNDIVDYELVKESFASYSQRLGKGIWTLSIPASDFIKEDLRLMYLKALESLATNNSLLLPSQPKEQGTTELTRVGEDGNVTLDLTPYIDTIATGLHLPKRWLIGDQEGAMESSGKDLVQVNQFFKSLQQLYLPLIPKILEFFGFVGNFTVKFHEDSGLTLIEKASILDKLTFLSDNEKREFMGFSQAPVSEKIEKVKTESMDISDNHITGEAIMIAPGRMWYGDHWETRSLDEIEKYWKSNPVKELYLGANHHPTDGEIFKDEAIGKVRLTNFDKERGIVGNYEIDTSKLSPELAWIRESAEVPLSIGMLANTDRDGRQFDLDVRSIIVTQHPRNSSAKIKRNGL